MIYENSKLFKAIWEILTFSIFNHNSKTKQNLKKYFEEIIISLDIYTLHMLRFFQYFNI